MTTKYTLAIYGRRLGAIEIFHHFQIEIEIPGCGHTSLEIRLEAYKQAESIRSLDILSSETHNPITWSQMS